MRLREGQADSVRLVSNGKSNLEAQAAYCSKKEDVSQKIQKDRGFLSCKACAGFDYLLPPHMGQKHG